MSELFLFMTVSNIPFLPSLILSAPHSVKLKRKGHTTIVSRKQLVNAFRSFACEHSHLFNPTPYSFYTVDIPHQRDRQCGPRILTFFLYLSDVEKGGGTNFPQLDITVEPKRGRALLWPSVLDSDPMAKDGRMMHQALEVIEGTKFAANGWIHMFDYLAPQEAGCN